MRYLGVSLTFKNVKDLYAKLYNILILKETQVNEIIFMLMD